MIRLPPRSTRTDTLFPYTTLCRSQLGDGVAGDVVLGGSEPAAHDHRVGTAERVAQHLDDAPPVVADLRLAQVLDARQGELLTDRSEERRVGKECVSTCRSRWSPYH